MDIKQKYGCDQHDLICEVLNVSPSPNAPGDTAFEAVVRLQQELGEIRNQLAAAEAKNERLQGNQITNDMIIAISELHEQMARSAAKGGCHE